MSWLIDWLCILVQDFGIQLAQVCLICIFVLMRIDPYDNSQELVGVVSSFILNLKTDFSLLEPKLILKSWPSIYG